MNDSYLRLREFARDQLDGKLQELSRTARWSYTGEACEELAGDLRSVRDELVDDLKKEWGNLMHMQGEDVDPEDDCIDFGKLADKAMRNAEACFVYAEDGDGVVVSVNFCGVFSVGMTDLADYFGTDDERFSVAEGEEIAIVSDRRSIPVNGWDEDAYSVMTNYGNAPEQAPAMQGAMA